MGSITTADLRVEGIEGLGPVLSFTLSQLPGEHACVSLEAVRQKSGSLAREERELYNRWIRVWAKGERLPLFSGRVVKLWEKEEKGYGQVRLQLVSGSILLDQQKESHSYQDRQMSYGQLLSQVAQEGGGMVLYPRQLDHSLLETVRIQYGETDWAFLKRLASHHGLSLYPQLEREIAGLWVGLPEEKPLEDFCWRGYTAMWDERFYV